MRSSEEFDFVPGARILIVPPGAQNVPFEGWNFDWVRDNTLIQYYENEEMRRAAHSGEFTRAVFGTDEVINEAREDEVGFPFVWDGGYPSQFFTGYSTASEPGGWASWQAYFVRDSLLSPETIVDIPGRYYQEYRYSLRRFTSYLEVDLDCYDIESAFLVSEFPTEVPDEFIFPLNDSIFVFVNGVLAYWTSTDLIGSGNIAQNRSTFEGIPGIFMDRNLARFPFTDGWYLTLGGSRNIANIAPYLRNGKNVIDVITDDYFEGGGMSRIDIAFEISGDCEP
jgi:hypothetical protein